MLNREDFLMIKQRRREGVFIKDIAAELGVHPRTVSRALKRDSEPQVERKRRGSKLDPFKDQVDQLLRDGIWNAAVIFQRIRASGYDGGSTILRQYIHPKRPLRGRKATVRYETAPGVQIQHDWGELWLQIAGERRKVYLGVNSLSYSRAVHVWAAPSQDAEHTYETIIRALEYFGGGIQRVLVDNQKSAVVDWADHKPTFNRRFLALGVHYGFKCTACRPYRAQTKGKVERMVHYVKHNALAGSPSFDSFAELNQYLTHWCDSIANRRFVRELGEAVTDRWAREREVLSGLALTRFDTAYYQSRAATIDAYVQICGNRYSVPDHLAGTQLQIRRTLDGKIEIRDRRGELVAQHRLVNEPYQTITVAEHHHRLWQELRVDERDPRYYEEVA